MAKRKTLAKRNARFHMAKNTGIMHLPEDVLVEILSRISILTLREKLILVCKTWASIILRNPIMLKRHAFHGEPGLFLQDWSDESITKFLELKEGKFKLRNYTNEFPGEILGTSRGVALFYKYRADGGTLHVANPFTGYVMKLPSPPAGTLGKFSNIGVIPCSGNGIVKVAILGLNSKGTYFWGLLTVGVDMSWRRIPSTLQEDTDYHLYNEDLISVGGVMYSIYRGKKNSKDRYIHAFDLRDETIRYFQVSKELDDGEYSWLMEMGEHLCCIVHERYRAMQHVWILKDLNHNIWVKLYTIDVNFKENIGNNYPPKPIGWLDNNQSLAFSVRKCIWDIPFEITAYNVKTGKKITCSEVDPLRYNVQQHKNTLFNM